MLRLNFNNDHTFKLSVSALLFSVPMCFVVWTAGLWVIQAAWVILWLSGLNRLQRLYKQHTQQLRLSAAMRLWFFVILSYLIWCAASVMLLKSPLQSLDNGIIFLGWLLCIPVLIDLHPDYKFLAYGCFLTLLISLAIALTQFHYFNFERAIGLYGNGKRGSGAIKFGDMALLLGELAFIFFAEQERTKYLGLLAIFLGSVICVYASARGGILALGLCVLIWQLTLNKNRFSFMEQVLMLLAIVAGLYVLNFAMNNYLLLRLLETQQELKNIIAFQLDSSMGIRLQLWYAALQIFLEHPIIGVGLNNFSKALLHLQQQHLISHHAASFAHAHNEFLCALATGGIVGFSLTLLLFILPMRMFWKDYHKSIWARAGFWSVCLMSFFALTDCIFDRRMTVMAFIVIISMSLAGNHVHKNQESC